MGNNTKTPFKPFAAKDRLKELLRLHFTELDEAARDPAKKVAWCSSMGPAELLKALGFQVFFPENHGALLGATRKANAYIPRANAAGYSPDVCSYLTADVGAFLAGETPLTGAYGIEAVPAPDVLVFNTNQCRDVQDWFSFYGRRFRVPVAGLHSPMHLGEVTGEVVEGMTAQLEGLIPLLERVAGRKLDPQALSRTVELAAETGRLWNRILASARARPSPMTFFDGTIHMAPAVVMRGEERAVDYYRLLLEEVEERVRGGVGAVEGERYRLFWDGMPVWGKLRELSGFFSSLGASVNGSTYTSSWVFDALDPDHPLESMARAYLQLFNSRSDEVKLKMLTRFIKDFGVDGVVYHEAKTCPNNSNTRYGLPQRVKEATGKPFAVIYGDLNDLRCFSEEQAKTGIEAFLEQIEAGSGG